MRTWGPEEEVTATGFRDACLRPNQLGLVQDAVGRGGAWQVPLQWVGPDPEGGAVDVAALREFVASRAAGGTAAEALVTFCDEDAETEDTRAMSVDAFLDCFDQGQSGCYLKDWHLQELTREGAPWYGVPAFLGDDFLNAYIDGGGKGFGADSDYRFVYLGTAGTYTPFHTDVFGSYSWSLNLAGVKEWWFVPPESMPSLGREPPLHWMKPFRQQRGAGERHGSEEFVLEYQGKEVAVTRFFQMPGELVFVPSGWGHQVWNLTPCLSVNHNWCNGHNVVAMTGLLLKEASYLDRQLQDVKDLLEEQQKESGGYAGHCEWLLHNAANWNVSAWIRLLRFAGERTDDEGAAAVLRCLELLSPLPWGTGELSAALASLHARGLPS